MTTRTGVAASDRAATAPSPSVAGPGGAAGLSPVGLTALLTGAALPMVDFFIVNVALPSIHHTLHASTAALELVVAGYGVAYGLLLVLGGRLGDAFGRRRLFIAGLVAFTLASLACGIAPTAAVLVVARVAQGAAAAIMLPQTLSTIQAATTPNQRSRAIGLYGAVGGLAAAVGQLLGGVLVAADIAHSSWRPIFLVNVPIGLIALVLALRSVPETRAANPIGVDGAGTVMFGATMLALLVPLAEGRSLGWPWWTWALLAVVPFAAAGFVAVERRGERAGRAPLLPPSLIRMPSMRLGLLLNAPWFAVFGGFMFAYAVTLQDGLRLGPLGSGLALAPMAVGAFVASLISARLVARLGSRVVPYGAAVQGLGILGNIVVTVTAWPHLSALAFTPSMFIMGFGQGMVMTTLYRVVLSKVPVDRAGAGSGALTTSQQAALALGVAILGTMFAALAASPAVGMKQAFVLVMAIQAAVAGVLVIAGRALPDPRVK